MFTRYLKLEDAHEDSVFLWGARQTGKSTLLKRMFPENRYYDLLKGEIYERFNRRPELLREELLTAGENELIIIDEVQKIPQLLDEVHWLISNRNLRFILCGSSARKLRRSGANLLGGRAIRNILFPLVSAEIPEFDLDRALNNGMLPRHYLAVNATKRLQAYIGDYLQEEIRAEALTRNLSTFGRFLEVAALSSGEMLNYNNIARECGVSAPTIKEYFSILEDTLVGYFIPAYRKVIKRRLIHAPRFYYFDLGLTNYLLRRRSILPGSPEYGKAFEHFIIQEVYAWITYNTSPHRLSYWRTASGFEVDMVLGDAEFAIEIKSAREIHSHHLKGLKAFSEEHPGARLLVVSMEKSRRISGNIEIFPVHEFLQALWSGRLLG
ncbi:MAG: AAA family ATPase [Bacteroidota bacterium]